MFTNSCSRTSRKIGPIKIGLPTFRIDSDRNRLPHAQISYGVSKPRDETDEQFGGNLNQVIAFGDAENDEEMLLASGMGGAMGNASEELKAKAAAIAPSVDEDGVAVFLEQLFRL